ncbi:MAG: 50S ribosomal protein L11 methyltransferase [Gammaproteobacteria bacterium]|nr:50S ribosomal protein L11 methyltransferase [Gammaproteobacteria bacterium]MDH3370153.1 50S ribosomal protein L11 methyltransferase [Gammaproteobacteria bacterium]MDH3406688.1 50S ribosomal protein L11 methyltransferase [Gammaproteobacteria bacterium]MDH5486694.1 50S ribosomal protein L11 methyltransferase [Gammaproteobacteria bacterium]
MSWLKLKLRVDQEHAEALAEALEEWGALSVTLEDAADQPLFETHRNKNPLWFYVSVTGLFPEHTDTDDILARAREILNLPESPAHEIDLLGDEDWAHSWMAHYKPLLVGRNLWVVPSWCTPPEPNAVNLILDPGLAFGTGDHPTTALCLDWLSEQKLAGKTVLDYGCGSGILSIAAIKLKARKAYAVDIDAQALEVTRRNAVHNGINTEMHVMRPSELPKNFQANIVIANILLRTLIELAPEIKARVRPDGWLVLSGLLGDDQAVEVRPHYEPPFEFTRREKQKWFLLAGHKPAETG